MSIAFTEHPEERYVEVVIDGAIPGRDLADVMTRARAFAEMHGQISVLKCVRRLGFVNPLTALPHAVTGLGMLGRIRRVAVVTDLRGLAPLTRASGLLSPAEIRQFTMSQDLAARAWLASPDTAKHPV